MLFNFLRTVQTKSISRLPLQTFVYKICCFNAPSFRNFVLFNQYLLCKHHISNIFSSLTVVRPPSEHKLIANNTKSKIVNSTIVVLPAHNFRCHIPRSARGVLTVFGLPDFGDSEICNPQIALVIEHDILWLDVPVDDSIVVHVLKSKDNICNHKLRLLLTERPVLAYVVPEIAPCHQIAHQVDVLPVLE